MAGAHSTETGLATDNVIGAIADIETLRQTTEKEAGFAMSRSAALHRLQELLDHEKEALRLRGPDSGHLMNVEVVKIEIGRVKGLIGAMTQQPDARNPYPARLKASWRDAVQGPIRNRGRRTAGRAGGR